MMMFANCGADSGIIGVHYLGSPSGTRYVILVVLWPSQGDVGYSWKTCVSRVAKVRSQIGPNKFGPELGHARSILEHVRDELGPS